MEKLKQRLHKTRLKAHRIYKKPAVFLSLNISGFVISILGVLLCFSIVGSAYYVNTTVNNQTVSAQKYIDNKLNTANDIVSLLSSTISDLATTKVVSDTISTVAERNVNRLNSFERTLSALNFQRVLSPTIDSVNDAKNNLQNLQNNAKNLGNKNYEPKALKKLQDRIAKTQKRIDHGFRNIRVITLIAFYALLAVAIIFIVSCINLVSITSKNIYSHIKSVRKNKK